MLRVLIDTDVLLRAFDRTQSAQHRQIFRALRKLWSEQAGLLTTSQNIAEFWNVATRPASARGGFGLSVNLVQERVQIIERFCEILPFTDVAYRNWRRLVWEHQLTGVSVHDARLVASMQAAEVSHILTWNHADFRRYRELTLWTPQLLLQE